MKTRKEIVIKQTLNTNNKVMFPQNRLIGGNLEKHAHVPLLYFKIYVSFFIMKTKLC